MTALLVALALGQLWLLWDVRRALRLRLRPSVTRTSAKAAAIRDRFPGAVPPERFVVMRWPQGLKHYGGCEGARARTTYEHQHPAPGETVEFWELDNRRGVKEG